MANKGIVPNDEVFKYYFYFIQERMSIFWRKYTNASLLTKDPILQTYKFTNVYRACDRVSQYLIKNVIYKGLERYNPEDVLLRILVFKVFNKIETWEYINGENEITNKAFNVQKLTDALTRRQQTKPIFSNAYMMAGSHAEYKGLPYKHQVWLQMIEDRFIKGQGLRTVLKAKSMAEVYSQLREYLIAAD